MADLFDIANLITKVGVDAVKIKREPGLPEKSSNEILTELFSTFNADEDIASPVDVSQEGKDDEGNDSTTGKSTKRKKKKSKSKHKHKDKKHKKKDGKNSSQSGSEVEENGVKKKKKHKKKSKRQNESGSDNSSDGVPPKKKIKMEPFSPDAKRKRKDYEPKTMLDLVQSHVKKEPVENFINNDLKLGGSANPELPFESRENVGDFEKFDVPRLLEKTDQPVKTKILIKDLKNSTVYNEAVKEVENKEKERAAKIEEGEISDSDEDRRTPTLSPSPARDSFDSLEESSSNWHRKRTTSPGRPIKRDLRYILKQKEKIKKLEGRRGSRSQNEDDKLSKDQHKKDSKSRDKRSTSCHSRDGKKSDRSSSHSRKRSRSRGYDRQRSRSNDRRQKNGERRSSRSRERSKYSGDYYDDRRSRSDGRNRDRYSRSRSKERKERIEIDKKKLLEIARKNAITMIKRGALPLAQQDKEIADIQDGGKSVDELTDFCKSLSKSEALGELSSLSSEEDGNETGKGFHHPFLLRERPNSIVMNIRDSRQLPTKTFQERTAESSTQLRLLFPVSSGQQHRKTENEWVEVIPKPSPPVRKPEPKKAFVKSTTLLTPQPFAITAPINPTCLPITAPVLTMPVPQTILPGPTVFPEPSLENVDIGTIVSQRLSAMRILRENPHDVEALNKMHHAQNEMQSWAESKQKPGQFTGSTDVKLLTPAELTSGYQAWARKDQLTSAAPVSGGMGMALLQKMGWRPGEGLGKNKEGTLEPLQLEVKLDKKGLVSEQDKHVRSVKPVGKVVIPTVKTLEGKHPVSLLGEYCSKRKYGAPTYELCFECGPDHKKNFLFKVKVNGIEYKPSVASPNKKQAKAEAAQICLQTLGLLAAQ